VIRLEPEQPAYRVLVADDRKTNRQVLFKMLTAVGFDVREVKNGKEAVRVFEEWKPHLILMDMVMPVMDGFEAMRKIKAMPYGHETVIFGVTASVLADERDSVFAAGAVEFIPKPFREHELFDAIRQHIGVRYIYADETETTGATGANEADLSEATPSTQSSLQELPPELIAGMREAAVNGYMKKLNQFIEQAADYNPQLAQSLQTMADAYEYDRLIEALESEK
jgi:CheY-like chemotaxis protein